MGLVGRKSFLRAKLHLIRVGRSLEPWAPQEIITDDHTDTLGPLCQVLVTLEPSPWRITRPRLSLRSSCKALAPAGALWCLGGEAIVIHSLSQQIFIVRLLVRAQRDIV